MKGMPSRTEHGTDRSATAGASAPYDWGPGPWDNDDYTWQQRSRMSGDLRPWSVGLPITGGPVRSKPGPFTEFKGGPYLKHPGGPDDEDMILSLCWCEERTVRIPIEWVREGWTGCCGAAHCSSVLVYPIEEVA